MKQETKNQLGIAIGLIVALIVIAIQPYSPASKAYATTSIGVALILFAYFTGVMALVIGLVSSFFGFIVGLPFIATVYGLIAASSMFFYNRIIGYTFKKLVKRVPAIQAIIYRVETNETYSMIAATLDRTLAKVGLKKIKQMELYEVTSCPHCMQLIPMDSKFCLHCGKEVMLK